MAIFATYSQSYWTFNTNTIFRILYANIGEFELHMHEMKSTELPYLVLSFTELKNLVSALTYPTPLTLIEAMQNS
jgi:hypothetical protein